MYNGFVRARLPGAAGDVADVKLNCSVQVLLNQNKELKRAIKLWRAAELVTVS